MAAIVAIIRILGCENLAQPRRALTRAPRLAASSQTGNLPRPCNAVLRP